MNNRDKNATRIELLLIASEKSSTFEETLRNAEKLWCMFSVEFPTPNKYSSEQKGLQEA